MVRGDKMLTLLAQHQQVSRRLSQNCLRRETTNNVLVLTQPELTCYLTIRANLFPKVTGSICRLPLLTFTIWSELIKLRDLLRLWVRNASIGILIPQWRMNPPPQNQSPANFFLGAFSVQVHYDKIHRGCIFLHGFKRVSSDELLSQFEFQQHHLRRKENSPVAWESSQVSFVSRLWFLICMYNII